MTIELTPIPSITGSLVSTDDLTSFGYASVDDGYLVRASTRVKAYVGQDIAAGTSTVDLRAPFLLPQRPVTAVTSVAVVESDGTTSTLTEDDDYTLEGQRIICDGYKDQLLRVTYTHGYVTLPDALREVICAIAVRIASAPAGLATGIQSESADGESISYGLDAFGGVAELTSAEKRVLNRLFPHTRRVPSVAVTL